MALTEEVEDLFYSIVRPLTLSQCQLFRDMGLRERTLALPVMMALLLTAVWRQIAAVSELAWLIRNEAVLWEDPKKVSQQVCLTVYTLPAILFLNVLNLLLPQMQQRWATRQRPLPPETAWAQERFKACLIVDGSTLDALIRKVGLLRDLDKHPLAVCRRTLPLAANTIGILGRKIPQNLIIQKYRLKVRNVSLSFPVKLLAYYGRILVL